MCLVRFEDLSHASSEYLWNWESHDMLAYKIYLELKPLEKKKYLENFELELLTTAQPSCQYQPLLGPSPPPTIPLH